MVPINAFVHADPLSGSFIYFQKYFLKREFRYFQTICISSITATSNIRFVSIISIVEDIWVDSGISLISSPVTKLHLIFSEFKVW